MKTASEHSLPVLLVDDESHALNGIIYALEAEGITNSITCQDSRNVLSLIDTRKVGVILLDLAMPYLSGEQLLPVINQSHPEIPIIVITGMNEIETAVRCMRAGAFDYIIKPVEEMRLISSVHRALEFREINNEYHAFKSLVFNEQLKHPEAFANFISRNSRIFSLFQYIESIAQSKRTVLITGETGVGKELLARALHASSKRTGPFVGVSIAGLDDNAFSDTLFGHVQGAYTGADYPRSGLIETAAEGTLFLDEIGDLSPESQVKLLRLLQEGEYYPLGADAAKVSHARIVVATNKNIQEPEHGTPFRHDLYYRLQTHHAHIPPLRERLDDISVLLDFFLDKAATSLNKKKPTPPRSVPR